MDENKILEMYKQKKEESDKQKTSSFSVHTTNPILQKMLHVNKNTEKLKFKFKDLFR